MPTAAASCLVAQRTARICVTSSRSHMRQCADESVSIIHLPSFPPCIDEFQHKRTLWGVTDSGKPSQKSQIYQAINAAKAIWKQSKKKPGWAAADHCLSKDQAAEESIIWEKWIWMTYSPTGIWLWFFCFKCGRSGVPLKSTDIFSCCPTKSYSEGHIPTLGDLEEVSSLGVAAVHWIIAWFGVDVPPRLNLQLIGFNVHFNASDFGWLRLMKDATGFSYIAQVLQYNGFRWMIIVQRIPLVRCGPAVNQSLC